MINVNAPTISMPIALRTADTHGQLSRSSEFHQHLLQATSAPVSDALASSAGATPIDLARAPDVLSLRSHQPLPLHATRTVDESQVRASAEQLVASALLVPLMEEMDSSALRPSDGPFAQSLGERRFGPLLHQHLADRIMQSRSFGLVDAVMNRMTAGTKGPRA